MGRNRREAAPADRGDARSLGFDAPARLRVIRVRDTVLLPRSNLQRERTLAGFGEHLLGVEAPVDLVGEPEPVETARSEDDSVEAALGPLAQAGIDVAEIGKHTSELQSPDHLVCR